MTGSGISGSYDTVSETWSLSANSFRINLAGGVEGSKQVNALSDTTIEVTVDPDKHIHTDYVNKMNSLQEQINGISVDVNTSNSRIKYIILAPLAIKASNVELKNVQFTGSIVITKAPECEQEIIADKLWYTATNDVVVDQDTNWNIKYNK